MIIERKGRGKELEKLSEIALMLMKKDREKELYKMIKEHPDLSNWGMKKFDCRFVASSMSDQQSSILEYYCCLSM